MIKDYTRLVFFLVLSFLMNVNAMMIDKTTEFNTIPDGGMETTEAKSEAYRIRIGTIGNSITHGVVLPDPETQAYPIQLGEMLKDVYGDTVEVRNFGLTTTTMLKNGDVSYWDTEHFKDYLRYAPEICLILLGTNDSKTQNWDEHGDEYIGDYLAMIDTIKTRNPYTKFMIGYPPPAFEVKWEIRDSVIKNAIIPAIDSIQGLTGAQIIDFYYPLLDSAHLFPDKIHPDLQGSRVMAQIILENMLETDIVHKAEGGLTFITGFYSGSEAIVPGDSTSLSWTTLNADSLLLNGEPVPLNGERMISPVETSTFTLIAFGKKSNDTLQLTQKVYAPEIKRVQISPRKKFIYVGDSALLSVSWYDQFDVSITNVIAGYTWTIAEGSGRLSGESSNPVYFVSEGADTSLVVITAGEVADTAMIISVSGTGAIHHSSNKKQFVIYPNPCNEVINLCFTQTSDPVRISFYNLTGVEIYQKILNLNEAGEQAATLNISSLERGIYLVSLQHADKLFTGKLHKSR